MPIIILWKKHGNILALKMKLLVVLQCAYGRNPRERFKLMNRRFWLKALWRSHTGKRLKEMLPDNAHTYITNASPMIGYGPAAIFKPSLSHIQSVINDWEPDKILACGKVAQKALDELGQPYIAAPHPAWWLLSKKMTADIKHLLD